jgi:type VI secretion system secreted protein VgrG
MSAYLFEGDGVGDDAEVVFVDGEEGLSQLYRFDVLLVFPKTSAAAVDLDAMLGTRGTLTIQPKLDSLERYPYRGIISEAELMHAVEGMTLVRVRLVPALWRLTQSEHSRMFTDLSVKDLLDTVIGAASLDAPHDINLGDHPTEEHICQYRESDFGLLARWMEREGIFFTFDHDDATEKLQIIDDAAALLDSAVSPVRYVPIIGDDVSGEVAFHRLRGGRGPMPTAVLLRDHDYVKPALDVSNSESVEGIGGEVVAHEERFFDPGDASRLSALRKEEFMARAHEVVANGAVFGLRPGSWFELTEHSRYAGRHLVVAVKHRGAQAHALLEAVGIQEEEGHRIEAVILPEAYPYRAPMSTAWPKVAGYQLGRVAGPSESDYAQLDEHGRYLVKMMFDESDLSGDGVSTRLRMVQPHAGSPEGWHFPLRSGTEVVVEFLGGDIDRPMIAGAVPDAQNPSPVTSSNHTQNVLQTGGETRFELEDDAGKQFIWIKTPPADTYLNLGQPVHGSHNITLHTDKDALFDFGSNQLIQVCGELDEQVTGDVSETYKSDQTSDIHGPQKTSVDNAVNETYVANQTTTVQGAPREELFNNGQSTLVLGAREETYCAGQLQQVFGTTDEFWIGGWKRTVSGATSEYHDGSLTEVVAGNTTELCPAVVTETFGPTNRLWSSFTWISPAVVLVAPSVSVSFVSDSELKVNDDNVKAIVNGSEWTSSGTTAAKLEVFGINMGATVVKAAATGVAIDLDGVKFGAGGIKIDVSALIFTTEGLEVVV